MKESISFELKKNLTQFIIVFLIIFFNNAFAGNFSNNPFEINNFHVDTIPPLPVVIPVDSLQKTDTVQFSKDSIEAPIHYEASDSGVIQVKTRSIYLYGKSKIKHKDVSLEAANINFNQEQQLIKAFGTVDTTGNPYSKPNLTQGESKTISDSIFFNLRSLKGLTKNSYLQDGEMFINAQSLKKINANEFFGFKAKFTTCNLDTPHFAFRAKKIKLITNKLAVSGPAIPEIEGVPFPIGIPFGIYPMRQGRHSGLLAPAYAVNESYGLGLEGLGYYKVINDYVDVTIRSNIYSFGGWMLNVSPKYQRRYKYQGGINFVLQHTKALNNNSYYGKNEESEFTVNKTFQFGWNHAQDPRVRPGTNFSANVNVSSTKFNQTVPNNPTLNYNNSLNSSISYSKDFRGKANLNMNLSHSQNNVTRLMNLTLPSLSFNVVTFYPLQRKEAIGTTRWYEKLGIGYSSQINNRISFYDTAFSWKKIKDTIEWDAVHNIPISLALPSMGPITISPNISFENRWFGRSMLLSWNGKKVDTVYEKGFYNASRISYGISGNTRIFGTILFGKNSRIKAIRHEIRPSIGFSYTPDLASSYHYTVQIDSFKNTIRMSKYASGYSEGNSGAISFGIDNLLEMKVKNNKDTTKPDGDKKIKLLDGFGITSSYNLLADSFGLSPFSVYLRSNLFSKINLTVNCSVDPYRTGFYGRRINQYAWQGGNPSIGTITSGNIALSTSFKSEASDQTKDKDRLKKDAFMTLEEQQQQLQYVRNNPAEFSDFNIPWSLSLSYSLSFSRVQKPDFSYGTTFSSGANFNGDFNMTEKWKLGGSGFFDFNVMKLQQLSMFVSREMHCWQMGININPIGYLKSFNITISPKAGILRDLRINRSRNFYTQ